MNWKKIIKDSNGKAPTTPIKDSIDDEMYNKKKIGGENWDENLHMIMGILDEFHKMQTAVEKTGHIPSQMATTSIIEHALDLIEGWIKEGETEW